MFKKIRLLVLNGEMVGKVWESTEVVRLGRQENLEIVMVDLSVSHTHAEIKPADDAWYLRDLGSTNGTFLNGNGCCSKNGNCNSAI